MGITIGTQLGSHLVTALLGRGGMGEVYRARDTKLKREVAIKILPDEFSRDPERVARFQREAEVLASLNHPNIAAIYDLDEANGSRFLVLELVEGDTLAERIRRGPLPIDEAVNIAKSICEALEAAHEKGVVHRDIKSANIKLTPTGQVKVLDFGLAKVREAGAAAAFSNSPTLLSGSMPGVILGTAAYMSPEQAKGKETDRTTDVWSFGCVLYEMLTGRAAFEGETTGEILGGIFKAEPDWHRLPAKTPEGIRHLLRRCLKKEQKQRLQYIGDARIEIEEALSGASESTARPAGSRTRERLWSVVAAVFLIGMAALAVPTIVHLREPPPAEAPEMRVDIVTPSSSDPVSFAISPDGRRLVFVASADGQPRLWLRPLDVVTAQPLAGTEGAFYPFWSPDSRSVGFFAGGKLKRVDIGGGLPQTLANAIGLGGAWGPEGVILFTQGTSNPIFRIPASGGEVVAVTKLDAPRQNGHRFPQFLPGGRQFLFYVVGRQDSQGIYLGSLDSPAIKRLTAAGTAGLYAPPGWLLFVRQRTLVARRFDLPHGELTGDPVTVADQVGGNDRNLGAFSVSAAGPIAYRGGDAGGRQLTWFDRSGKALGTVGAPDFNGLQDPAISPDGRRVAVDRVVQGNGDIWLLDGTRTTRFTFDASADAFPVWSPDGSRILFRSNRKGDWHVYQKPSNGSGAEELLYEALQPDSPSSWSADGRFILLQGTSPKTIYDLWVLPMSGANASPAGRSQEKNEGDRKARPFLSTPFDERNGQFSPDGQWVAYRSNESGQFEIYVRPFPGPGGQWQVSTAGGIAPRWRRDGKELYYVAPDGRLLAVPIATKGVTLEPGTPVPLFQTRIVGGGTNPNRPQYDVAPDGRFLINITTEDATTSPITLLQNWKPTAK